VAILQSEAQNQPLLSENAAETAQRYQKTLNRWSRIFNVLQPKIRHTLLTDKDISENALLDVHQQPKFDVLIVSSARTLSQNQQKALLKFAKNGGGIWFSWAVGVYDTQKKWQGWSFLEQLMGIKIIQDKTQNATEVQPFVLYGQTPFTVDIPAGYRLHLGNYHQPIKAEIISPETKVAGTWHLAAGASTETLQQSVGLVYKNYGKGRLVYMGFESDVFEAKNGQIGLTDEDELVLKRFFWNGLQWLSKKHLSGVSTWKYGYQAAASVGFMRSNQSLSWKPKTSFPYTIYGRNAMPQKGVSEIGVWGKNADMDREQAMKEVRTRLSNDVTGIYTHQALNHMLRLFLSGSGYGYAVSKTNEPYWSVPRVLPNRINEFVQIEAPTDSLYQPKAIWQTFASGGFLPLYYHEDFLLQNPKIAAQADSLFMALSQQQFWISSGRDLADWLRTRTKLSTQINTYNQKRLGVQIINNGGAVVDSVGLYVYLDRPFDAQEERLSIRPEDVWETFIRGDELLQEGRDYRFLDAQNTTLQIRIKNLKPYQFRAYQIDRIPLNEKAKKWWEL
jgi:hypothetical protein